MVEGIRAGGMLVDVVLVDGSPGDVFLTDAGQADELWMADGLPANGGQCQLRRRDALYSEADQGDHPSMDDSGGSLQRRLRQVLCSDLLRVFPGRESY